MKNCIDVKNLTKRFKEQTVVNRLTFTIKQGEVFGILGHNGAGKTTTVEMLLGLQDPTQGEVRVMGMHPQKQRSTLFQQIGVQLQSTQYQNNIKVIEVCQEMASLYHDPANIDELLRQFQLDGFRNHMVSSLSGGEKQKLSLVVALIPKPSLIFLDELTTGLDVVARRDVWNTLLELKKQGLSMVLTTHYMEEAEALCDRILLLKRGKCVMEGTVKELKQERFATLEEAYLHYMEVTA